MSGFLSNIGTFFSTAIGWMGQILDLVTNNPALTVLVLAMPICGYAFGLFRRLIYS